MVLKLCYDYVLWPPPQILVMFYAVELLRVMETIHSAGFLHGDIKSDNILLRFDVLGEDELWDRQYHPDGSQGWSSCGTTAAGAERQAAGCCAQPLPDRRRSDSIGLAPTQGSS